MKSLGTAKFMVIRNRRPAAQGVEQTGDRGHAEERSAIDLHCYQGTA
jgi:hypothetical protein